MAFPNSQEFPKLKLPIQPPFAPMEARAVSEIPDSPDWLFEPKWDGFRCLAFRENEKIALQSKAGQPLTRYFPELLTALADVDAPKFVLDGEIVIETNGHLDFNALLQRIHPAESRIKHLSKETPSHYFCFDLLVDEKGTDLTQLPLSARKEKLEELAKHFAPQKKTIRLAPVSENFAFAESWLKDFAEYGCDGIVAKLKDEPYHSGDREGMVKIKRLRTADCVIGGFRYATKKENGVGSILLGLYNKSGLLDHVGFCSGFSAQERKELLKKLQPLRAQPGFSGKAPGGPSRWTRANDRSTEWEPLQAVLVVEVQYDHFSGGRFRHGTRFLRWRPDKLPQQCTTDQIEYEKSAPPRAA